MRNLREEENEKKKKAGMMMRMGSNEVGGER